MRIFLIRHGKTEANEKHLYCGSTDISLSDSGLQELSTLSYQVGDVQFITSGMRRTNETLKALFGDVAFTVDRDFREIDFGIFEMKSYEELKDTFEYQIWLSGDNFVNTPPNGESGYAMTTRVLSAFRRLDQDSVVITHGGVIAAIMESLFPMAHKNRYQWQPKPGHGYEISEGFYRYLP